MVRLFDVFPEDQQETRRDSVKDVYHSYNLAARRPEGHALEAQRFDIQDPAGQFVERYWRIVHTPLRDSNEQLLYFLVRIKDITAEHVRGVVG